jgi:hypothetical protein
LDDKKSSENLFTRVEFGLVDGLLVDMTLVNGGDRGHGDNSVRTG